MNAEPKDALPRIGELLDQQVRPEFRAEGSDIELVGIDEDWIVQVRVLGACAGCGSPAIHYCTRAEAVLKRELPQIKFLEPVP